MKHIAVFPRELPEELTAGFAEMVSHEGFTIAPDGIPVTACKGETYSVRRSADGLAVSYQTPVQFFRALSYLKEGDLTPCEIDRQPVFKRNGIMLDCSRNAVPTLDTIRSILRKMALMGLNTAMLYTEDTYEIPTRPYFGYLRGRYSLEDIRALDDYAADLGIELVPCIQTLAHLERALHWPQVDPDIRDTNDIMMVGEEKVYQFIDEMLDAVTKAFRTKRIHIGMDEAWSLGLGNYRFKHGFVPAPQLMKEHLAKVCELVHKHGLEPMIWSDMYLRMCSPTGGYYDAPDVLPQDVLDAARDDVGLVYWDYYHSDPAEYQRLMKIHEQLNPDFIFAGGLWTWTGPVPNPQKIRSTSIPALKECEAHGIREVLSTAWGDNGAEASLLTALYGMQLYAEYDYTGRTDEESLAERFAACTGEHADAFFRMDEFNMLPGITPHCEDPVNASKFLLYEDPLLPLFSADTAGLSFTDHYRALAESYTSYTSEDPAFEALYRFYQSLAELLSLKCLWREQAAEVQRSNAAQAVQLAEKCAKSCDACKLAWYMLWKKTNRPYGFEVIDVRLSGLKGRFETAAREMLALQNGEIESIETLSAEKLRYITDEEGRFNGCYAWSDCISACRI